MQTLDNEHAELVKALSKPGAAVLAELTPMRADLWHMATGICGEAGELLDAVKKAVVYCKTIDRANVVEELGDLEFYMQGLRAVLDITREETLAGNVHKLRIRYGSTYSNDAAQQRVDKVAPARKFMGQQPATPARRADDTGGES